MVALKLNELNPCTEEYWDTQLMLRALTEDEMADAKKMKCAGCGEEIKPGERYEYYDDGYATMPVHSFHGYSQQKTFIK